MNEKLYRLMNWPEIEAIIYSEEDDPHRLLGPHREGNATVVQAFYPGAVSMELKLARSKERWKGAGGTMLAIMPHWLAVRKLEVYIKGFFGRWRNRRI